MKIIVVHYSQNGGVVYLNADQIVSFEYLKDGSTLITTTLGVNEPVYVKETPEQIVVKLGVTAR